ncbi:hypothetical protein DL98DRAFT_599435 [Cadophora sp. DSE1049]|nr:hypothetical protein DL98DRAFT_599435 [Cadophora sp. DSE1049]
MFSIISTEVLRQCGPQDGVNDTIISDPIGCNFNPLALLCNRQLNYKVLEQRTTRQAPSDLHRLGRHQPNLRLPHFLSLAPRPPGAPTSPTAAKPASPSRLASCKTSCRSGPALNGKT